MMGLQKRKGDDGNETQKKRNHNFTSGLHSCPGRMRQLPLPERVREETLLHVLARMRTQIHPEKEAGMSCWTMLL